MPIEDVDYLLKNSEEEHIVMLVDSRDRDPRVHPYPNSFDVVFPEPFKNVTGVEVLNTSIPRTMFMLDSHNEVLVVHTGTWRGDAAEARAVAGAFNHASAELVVRLEHQDFQNSDNFFNNINEQLPETVMQLDNRELEYFDAANSYERKKADFPIPRFASPYTPFAINTTRSTSSALFGLPRIGLRAEDRRKYVTTRTVFDNLGRVVTNVTPYDAVGADITARPMDATVAGASPRTCATAVSDSVTVVATVNESDTSVMARFECPYAHRPEHLSGSFLSEIEVEFSSKHAVAYRNTFPTITLSMVTDDPTDPSFVHECEQTGEGTALRFRIPIRKRWVLECLPLVPDKVYTFTALARVPPDTIPPDVLNEMRAVVYVGYGHFVFTRVPHAPSVLVSKPIVDEAEASIGYTRTLSDTETEYQITDVSSQDTFAVRDASARYLGVLPTRSTEAAMVCTEITLRVPHDPRDSTAISFPPPDVQHTVYWMDLYHGADASLFARVFLRPSFSNDAITLEYRNDDLEGQVLNSVVYSRVQFMNDDEYADYTCRYQVFRLVDSSTTPFVRLHNAELTVRWVALQTYGVQSPGMINLATERYLVLRCDEIEEHVRGSRSVREFSPGLGLINIDVQGYAVDNQEFFSVKYRKFHPIGTVSRLAFRFERGSDHALYDFKNVDLHFVLAIRFLRPLMDRNFTEYTLNPDYDPNYMGYIRHSMQANEHDTTDDEHDDDADFAHRFRRRELLEGGYSSSEDARSGEDARSDYRRSSRSAL